MLFMFKTSVSLLSRHAFYFCPRWCVYVIFSTFIPPNVMPKCYNILTCMLGTILAHSSCCMSQMVVQLPYRSALHIYVFHICIVFNVLVI